MLAHYNSSLLGQRNADPLPTSLKRAISQQKRIMGDIHKDLSELDKIAGHPAFTEMLNSWSS